MLGHKEETVAGKTATCTEKGLSEGKKCSVCGTVTVAQKEIPALGHKEETVAGKTATCTEKGLTEGKKCSVCGTITAAQKEIPILGHKDANNDGKCDTCGAQMGTVEDDKHEVIRVGGSVRSETARMIADELKETLKIEKFETIIYASGDAYPDALTGTYLANLKDAPILLYRKAQMQSNLDYIKANLTQNGIVYILGGESAVPANVKTELEAAGIKVQRLAGVSRYTTNLDILNAAGFKGGETVLVCSGNDYPDALAASATGMPLLLVNNKLGKLNADQIAYLKNLNKCEFILIGGEAAISAKLANELAGYDKDGKVDRIGGASRYETCQMLADKFFGNADKAIVAYGRDYPDALCGGTLGYALNAPVILVQDSRAQFVAEYLAKKGIDSGYVLGGTGRVGDAVANKIFGK